MRAGAPSEKPLDGRPLPASFAVVISGRSFGSEAVALGEVSSFRGEPTLRLSWQEIDTLSKPYQNALARCFLFNRPSMEFIKKFFTFLGLKRDCAVGLLNAKHALIRPSVEEDYTHMFARRLWYVNSSSMLISKWTLKFRANHELAIAPIWVSFPDLPIPFFSRKTSCSSLPLRWVGLSKSMLLLVTFGGLLWLGCWWR